MRWSGERRWFWVGDEFRVGGGRLVDLSQLVCGSDGNDGSGS